MTLRATNKSYNYGEIKRTTLIIDIDLLKSIHTGYQILKPANELVWFTHPVSFSDKWIHVVMSYKGKSLVND